MTVMPLPKPFAPEEMKMLRAFALPVDLAEKLERVQAFLFGEESAPPMPTAHEFMCLQTAVDVFLTKHNCTCDKCQFVASHSASAFNKLANVMRPVMNDAGFAINPAAQEDANERRHN